MWVDSGKRIAKGKGVHREVNRKEAVGKLLACRQTGCWRKYGTKTMGTHISLPKAIFGYTVRYASGSRITKEGEEVLVYREKTEK